VLRRRDELLAQGFCTLCGKKPLAEGHKNYCEECRERSNACKRIENAQTEWAVNRRTAFERDDHKCLICDAEAQYGHHIDESGQDEHPNHDVENIASLCKGCHVQVTGALELLKNESIDAILQILAASPKNRLQEFLQ
jgi:5-methylcytosine-specific restriction endonuclease McrA